MVQICQAPDVEERKECCSVLGWYSMSLMTNSKYDVPYISMKLVKEFFEVSQIVGMPASQREPY